ncbi:MAG: cytochrome c-type biogenesis protein CcmH, partial [Solirubrobacteraceae bacterium]
MRVAVRAVAAGVGAELTVLAVVAAVAGATGHRTKPGAGEREVICVSCNVPLVVAVSPQAEQERARIASLVARGMTKGQVLDQLVDDYGPGVLASPEARGAALAVYLIPLAAALVLLLAAAVLLPRWRHAGAAARSGRRPRAGGAPR